MFLACDRLTMAAAVSLTPTFLCYGILSYPIYKVSQKHPIFLLLASFGTPRNCFTWLIVKSVRITVRSRILLRKRVSPRSRVILGSKIMARSRVAIREPLHDSHLIFLVDSKLIIGLDIVS